MNNADVFIKPTRSKGVLIIPLQVAFTLVFWLTLRQFTWELSSRRRANHPEVESLQTLSESTGMKIIQFIIRIL